MGRFLNTLGKQYCCQDTQGMTWIVDALREQAG